MRILKRLKVASYCWDIYPSSTKILNIMAKKLINKEEAFIFKTNEGDTMDLNDFKEPGFYHSIVDAKNAPKSSSPSIFFVYTEKNKNMIIQFFFVNTRQNIKSCFILFRQKINNIYWF